VQLYSLLDFYLTSLAIGLVSLPGPYCREAAARVVNPLSYPRYMEYKLALGQLGPLGGCRVLDIGSPKLPVLVLARKAQCELYATDVRDYFIGPTAHFLTRMGLSRRLGKDLHLEVQDARQLSYADEWFDRAFSISVLEHIPADGDTRAIQEIARVLRPGGVLTLTVPFAASGYHEEFLQGEVYERQAVTGGTFYQRYYDLATLHARLVAPAGLQLAAMTFFGEPGLRFEPYWNRVSMWWKLPLLWAQPFLAQVFLRKVGMDRLDAATGVALKLVKS
jgi:SAM-dependent methyltransferase